MARNRLKSYDLEMWANIVALRKERKADYREKVLYNYKCSKIAQLLLMSLDEIEMMKKMDERKSKNKKYDPRIVSLTRTRKRKS